MPPGLPASRTDRQQPRRTTQRVFASIGASGKARVSGFPCKARQEAAKYEFDFQGIGIMSALFGTYSVKKGNVFGWPVIKDLERSCPGYRARGPWQSLVTWLHNFGAISVFARYGFGASLFDPLADIGP